MFIQYYRHVRYMVLLFQYDTNGGPREAIGNRISVCSKTRGTHENVLGQK